MKLHAGSQSGDERYRQQLTPQELQVALTLAEGTTTREAAARLYLSPKTVEYHLRHVYDKLEIRSREELRAALTAHPRLTSARKALMFTDLTGSTSLVEAIGDAAWHDLKAWLDGELRRSFAEHHGREGDHAGDGFFVVFDAASNAIDCAVSIQRRLSSHRRPRRALLHDVAPAMIAAIVPPVAISSETTSETCGSCRRCVNDSSDGIAAASSCRQHCRIARVVSALQSRTIPLAMLGP